jgi:geranylgeranyl diphosphate synthase type II
MYSIAQYTDFFTSYLEKQIIDKEPKNLYDPISYILSQGGKRIRPVLTLLTAEIFGKDFQSALPAALALEVFHNASLIHDDIIDDDPIRRGNPTVHIKWDINSAILSGDAMIILTYRCLENYEPNLALALIKEINLMGLQVCEGQRWDVDFETRQDVTVSQYLKMIEYKTAALLAASMRIGAIIAQASQENCNLIYDFGLNLGMAFQLQDDYLDIFGDTPTFGRRLGGDVISNKKTFLYLKALELLAESEKKQLKKLYRSHPKDNLQKIEAATKLFEESGVSKATRQEIESYTFKAFDTLDKINIGKNNTALLKTFGESLMGRKL